MGDDVAQYLTRKQREIALLDACLDPPLALAAPASIDDVIDVKRKLAGAVRAQRSLASWEVTETAQPASDEWRSGAFTFSYGYQRADLEIRGPPIYPAMDEKGYAVETLYTCAGMGAAAALFTALGQVLGALQVHVAREAYAETRELLERMRPRVRLASWRLRRSLAAASGARVLLVDSVTADIPHGDDPMPRDTALVAFDTTCFWRTSGRIARVVRWARRHDVPVAMFRSHNKLDSFGVEYGRLGSIVLSWRRRSAARWMREAVRETRDTIRLLGVAAIPAHLPPFTDDGAYVSGERRTHRCAWFATRGALLEGSPRSALGPGVVLYPHGLYLTIATFRGLARERRQARRDRVVRGAVGARAAGPPCRLVRLRFHRRRVVHRRAHGQERDAHRARRWPGVDDRRARRGHRRMVRATNVGSLAMTLRTETCWIDTAPATRYPAVSRSFEGEVVVVGAGIVGLTAAWVLAKAGLDVTVLEAARVGRGVTARSTAKVTSQHGLALGRIAERHDEARARMYAEANAAGAAWVVETAGALGIECDLEARDAYAYVTDEERLSGDSP